VAEDEIQRLATDCGKLKKPWVFCGRSEGRLDFNRLYNSEFIGQMKRKDGARVPLSRRAA